MKSLVSNYFQRTKEYPTWRFVLEMSALAFILKILAVIIVGPVFGAFGIESTTDLELEKTFLDYQLWQAVGLIIIFASFETITSQMFMLWVAKKISRDTAFRLLLSAIVFALLHVEPILIAAVFPIGLILSWSYLIHRERSVWQALWVTTAVHVVHNLFALWLVSLG